MVVPKGLLHQDRGLDYLGPEGGVKGGEIVAVGTPEDVVKVERSFTGQYLAPLLRAKDGKVTGKLEAVAAE